jgi:hypothetical protein
MAWLTDTAPFTPFSGAESHCERRGEAAYGAAPGEPARGPAHGRDAGVLFLCGASRACLPPPLATQIAPPAEPASQPRAAAGSDPRLRQGLRPATQVPLLVSCRRVVPSNARARSASRIYRCKGCSSRRSTAASSAPAATRQCCAPPSPTARPLSASLACTDVHNHRGAV